MRFGVPVILWLAVFATAASAGEIDEIRVWRYFGGSDFARARFMLWRKPRPGLPMQLGLAGQVVPGGFIADNQTRVKYFLQGGDPDFLHPAERELALLKKSECSSLLKANQDFPLSIMRKRAVLDATSYAEQIRMPDELDPAQVTFVESLSSTNLQKLKDQYGEELPPFAVRDDVNPEQIFGAPRFQRRLPDGGREDYVDFSRVLYKVTSGTGWLISGQAPGRTFRLALEKGRLRRAISRRKHPFVWEIGRLSQTEPGGAHAVIQTAALNAFFELRRQGGELSQGTVFAHVMDEAHARLYAAKYGMTKYTDVVGGAIGEQILAVPLASLMAQFDYAKTFAELGALKKLGLPHTDSDLLGMALDLKRLGAETLVSREGEEWLLQDYSGIFSFEIERILARYGIRLDSPEARAVVDALDVMPPRVEDEYYADFVRLKPAVTFLDFFIDRKLLYLETPLLWHAKTAPSYAHSFYWRDKHLKIFDPDGLIGQIGAAYAHLREKMAKLAPAELATWKRERFGGIGLSIDNQALADALVARGGKRTPVYRLTAHETHVKPENARAMPPSYLDYVWFDPETLEKLAHGSTAKPSVAPAFHDLWPFPVQLAPRLQPDEVTKWPDPQVHYLFWR